MSLHAFAQRLSTRALTLFSSKAWSFGSLEPVSGPFNVALSRWTVLGSFGHKLLYSSISIIPRVVINTKAARSLHHTAENAWRSTISRKYFKHLPVLVTASIVGWIFPSTMDEVYYVDKSRTYSTISASGTVKAVLQVPSNICLICSCTNSPSVLISIFIFTVTRSEDNVTDHVLWVENTLMTTILRLPNKEWPENWDFLAQCMLRVAFRRGAADDPQNGTLTTQYILEQVLEKRKLLPPTVDATAITIIACTELYRRYYVKKEFKKAIELSKLHFHALEKLLSNNITEQQSLVVFQLAVCNNMLGEKKLAEEHLRAAFSFLQLRKLPPQRFKQHLLRLIALCYNHQLIDTPPKDSFPFLSYARSFYEELNKKLSGLEADHPWNRIIDDLESELKKNLIETQDMIETQRELAEQVEKESMTKAMAVAEWTDTIAPNPNYTINEKVAALRTLLLQFELSDKEAKALKELIRKFRAANALDDDFVPSEKKSTRTRF